MYVPEGSRATQTRASLDWLTGCSCTLSTCCNNDASRRDGRLNPKIDCIPIVPTILQRRNDFQSLRTLESVLILQSTIEKNKAVTVSYSTSWLRVDREFMSSSTEFVRRASVLASRYRRSPPLKRGDFEIAHSVICTIFAPVSTHCNLLAVITKRPSQETVHKCGTLTRWNQAQ